MSLITRRAHAHPDWPGLGQSIATPCLAWQTHRWAECQISSQRPTWTKTNFLMEPEVAVIALDRDHKKLFWAEQLDITLSQSFSIETGMGWNGTHSPSCLDGASFFLFIKSSCFLSFRTRVEHRAATSWYKKGYMLQRQLLIESVQRGQLQKNRLQYVLGLWTQQSMKCFKNSPSTVYVLPVWKITTQLLCEFVIQDKIIFMDLVCDSQTHFLDVD